MLQNMLRIGRVPLMALVGAMLLLGLSGANSAQAAGPIQGRAGVYGEVTVIGADSLTVEGRRASITVLVDEHTWFRVVGQEEASLSDFQVGDQVLARGMRQENGTLLAALVVKEPAGERVVGRVQEVTSDHVLLTRPDGIEMHLFVDGSTLLVAGQEEISWDEGGHELVQEGMPLAAYGAISDDGSELVAHTLLVVPRGRGPLARHGLAGEITSIEGDSFVVNTLRGESVMVQTGEQTHYRLLGEGEGTLSDFTVGDSVVVLGKRVEDDSFQAWLVALRPAGRPVVGVIESIEGDTLFVMNRTGLRLNITVSEETRFRVGQDVDATLSDFEVGDRILAVGEVGEDGSDLLAALVAKRGDEPLELPLRLP